MTITADELYQLLPSVHRVRDADRGYPLKALISVLADQADVVAQDIDGLYANWFIETCAEWVVPYIGDLLRVRRLIGSTAGASERSYVANTLGYRRRKGTVSVIERLAYDVTGWRAKAIESFHALDATQNLNHLRPQCVRTPDLRVTSDLELLGGPFETASHTVEVRRVEPRRGRYNIPDIAVMLWRLQAYPVVMATARPAPGPPNGRYTFNPRGLDEPLFNLPRTEALIDHLAGENDVPGPLRPRALHDELQGPAAPRQYFAPGHEILAVAKLDQPGGPPQPPGDLQICDLSDWDLPTWNPPGKGKVSVDVTRGRLAFNGSEVPAVAAVSYAYGFSADVGAGPYSRLESVQSWLNGTPTWLVGVIQDLGSQESAPDQSLVFATLSDALTAWNNLPAGAFGVICVMDSCTYPEKLPAVTVPAGSRLAIMAAALPGLISRDGSQAPEPEGLMPVVNSDVSVSGSGGGQFVIDGLLVQGKVTVSPGDLGGLRLASSTVTGPVTVNTSTKYRNEQLQIEITSCLCGPIYVPLYPIGGISVTGSVIDAGGKSALYTVECDVSLKATTVFGTTSARTLNASSCIFTELVSVERVQAGCVRFSYVPEGSTVPRAFHCQPGLALTKAAPAEASAITARLTPVFTSERLGDPGYAQLSQVVASEILSGADNGSEMGVFNQVEQPQREANLRAALDEYLRFGLEAGIFYVN